MKRKPTAQHFAQGTYRADRHGARLDVVTVSGIPAEPQGLTAAQRDLWNHVCDTLPSGCLGEVDTESLVALVEVYELMRLAKAQLEDDVCDKNARIAYCGYFDRFTRMAREFGLTPLSRSSVKVPTVVEEDDPMESIARMMGGSLN